MMFKAYTLPAIFEPSGRFILRIFACIIPEKLRLSAVELVPSLGKDLFRAFPNLRTGVRA